MKDFLKNINTQGIVAVVLSASVVISMAIGADRDITMSLVSGLIGFIGGQKA